MKRCIAPLTPIAMVALTMVALTQVACSGGAAASRSDSSSADDPGRASDGEPGSSSASSAKGKQKGKGVRFGDEQPRAITLVTFVNGALALGFSDGALALFDPAAGTAKLSKVSQVYPVVAVAPSGDLALLSSGPPAIVNFDGDLILQMNTVPSFESGVFGREGLALYIADKEGKVRIWGQAHSFEKDQHKEKLEGYLNRQAPDFHVEFPPIRGPIASTPSNQIVVTDNEGIVRLWDPTRPSNSKRIMKIDGHARSVAAAGQFLFVTSTHGAFKIGNLDGTGYLPWTQKARGGFVAASDLDAETFFLLDDGLLVSRRTEDGSANWELPLPAGPLCGLAISDDAAWIAACVSNRVTLVDAKTGNPQGYMFRDGEFAWESL